MGVIPIDPGPGTTPAAPLDAADWIALAAELPAPAKPALLGDEWAWGRVKQLEFERQMDGATILGQAETIAHQRAKIEARDQTNAAQHAMIADRDETIVALRADLAKAGAALDERNHR